ncbi:MAG: response regulator transcription factor [Oscillochloris sp.]|nr:response regulator transcription factor [Oscillochloris sp.]
MSNESARILIVDDEAIVRRVLGDGLSQTGYQVRTAASADEALALLAQQPVDLLLLDLQLGDRNGIDVLREVRAQRPQLPILILTAHGSLTSAIDAVRLDADDYLLKPIGLEALRTRVAEVLARYKAEVGRQERLRTMYRHMQALIADEGLTPAQAVSQPAQKGVYVAGPLAVDVPRHQVRINGQLVDVTPSEFAILHTLVCGRVWRCPVCN